MPKGPIRRSQLIAPFGVGALSITRDGTSVITCGLDHWFEREDQQHDAQTVDTSEFVFEEWRLQRTLGVDNFRLPPDYRIKRANEQTPNSNLTIPFLRFPKWHFCPYCYRLRELPLTLRPRENCQECLAQRRRRVSVVQVPFVAMCDAGHLQDFPWREWVHASTSAVCEQPMRLYATGGASLSAQIVECECGAKRTLAQITSADANRRTTYLSSNLSSDRTPYLCRGFSSWLGAGATEVCTNPLRASLRSASNLYFADIRTALYLPRKTDMAPSTLIAVLEQPPLSTLVRLLSGAGATVKPDDLRGQHGQVLQPFTDSQLVEGIAIVTGKKSGTQVDPAIPEDDPETAFRRAEYATLGAARNEAQLFVQQAALGDYDAEAVGAFAKVMLVHRLRETRVFAGFTRVFPENDQTIQQRKMMLRLPGATNDRWLPAYIVFGEGMFFQFDEARVRAWESRNNVQQRIAALDRRYQQMQQNRRGRLQTITPRLVLLHTFAHLLINRLTFECGYSTAALRERLYVSSTERAPMAGVLIYTAAGDAEGTLGGLVRMGKPGNLEPVLRRALETAQWCSVDPVCMEVGRGGGQGPDSCNLAACHSCALVPETACEYFNRFLDRACLVGDTEELTLGFFDR
jgi:hypothetical protein